MVRPRAITTVYVKDMGEAIWKSAAEVKRTVTRMSTGAMPTVSQPVVVGQIAWKVSDFVDAGITVNKKSTGGYTPGTVTVTPAGSRIFTPKAAEVNADALVM
eukprot:3673848-Amphidinium_carterae.1